MDRDIPAEDPDHKANPNPDHKTNPNPDHKTNPNPDPKVKIPGDQGLSMLGLVAAASLAMPASTA